MAKADRTTRKRYVYKMMSSPVGRLKLVATDEGLAGILWENDRPHRVRFTAEAHATPIRCSSRPSASSRNILRDAGRRLS